VQFSFRYNFPKKESAKRTAITDRKQCALVRFQLMRGVAWDRVFEWWRASCLRAVVVARSQYNYTKKMSAVCQILPRLSSAAGVTPAHFYTPHGMTAGLWRDVPDRRIGLLYSALVRWSAGR